MTTAKELIEGIVNESMPPHVSYDIADAIATVLQDGAHLDYEDLIEPVGWALDDIGNRESVTYWRRMSTASKIKLLRTYK